MEFNDTKPIYLQLADQIMDDIAQGWSHNGDRLASVREYAAKSGVNANTVMRTYSWLQQEGVIYNQRGIGYFYSLDAKEKVMAMRMKIFTDREMEYFFKRLMQFGIDADHLKSLYSDYISKHHN